MKFTTLLLLIIFSLNASGGEITCPKVESKGEGHWPIPPEGFTEQRYNDAIKKLNDIVKVKAYGGDYYEVNNHLMYIRGYMLKLYSETEAFCEFIRKEAYVRH